MFIQFLILEVSNYTEEIRIEHNLHKAATGALSVSCDVYRSTQIQDSVCIFLSNICTIRNRDFVFYGLQNVRNRVTLEMGICCRDA